MESRFNLFDSPTAAKAAKRFYGIGQLLETAPVPKDLQELVALRISQINGCGMCVDMHTKDAAAHGESALRLNLVSVWRETTVFTEAERAALAFAEEGTRMADAYTGVSDETWAELRKHFDDDQTGVLILLVSMMNMANRLNVITRLAGGSYQPGMAEKVVEEMSG